MLRRPKQAEDEPLPIRPREGVEGIVYDVNLSQIIASDMTFEQILALLRRLGLADMECCVQVVVPGFNPHILPLESVTHPDMTGQEDTFHQQAQGNERCACVITLNMQWAGAGDARWRDGVLRKRSLSFAYIPRFASALLLAVGKAARKIALVFDALRQLNPEARVSATGHSLGAAMLLSALLSITEPYAIDTLTLVQTALPAPNTQQDTPEVLVAFYDSLIDVLGLVDPERTPVGNIVWGYDAQDNILGRIFAALDETSIPGTFRALLRRYDPDGYSAMGTSNLFAERIEVLRNAVSACHGWGSNSVRAVETNSTYDQGHGRFNPAVDSAVSALLALAATLGSGRCE